jgi:ABC-2 type transport system permease protein
MSKSLVVAKWEFIEKIKTKAFLIGLFMTPLIMGMAFLLPKLLGNSEEEHTKVIGVIDETQWIGKEAGEKILSKYILSNKKPEYEIKNIVDESFSTEQLKVIANAKLSSGELHGYFVIPKSILDSGMIEYRAENVSNYNDQGRFSKLLENIIFERRATNVGISSELVKKITSSVELKMIKVSKDGKEKETSFLDTFFTGYIFIILLMFLVMSTGQMLIRSVVEEKSNRIVEVLVSSCTPLELMSGKIIGLSALGLATIAFWISLLIAVNFATPIPFVAGDNLMFLLIYFILGYFMYVAIFITAGAMVSTEQEAQQMTGYVTILLMLPIFMATSVMINPGSTLVKILSLIPLLTPTMMAFRFSIQTPDWWEIITSIVILLATISGLMWVAAKVFRIGILITGKRPNLKEIIAWLRTE